MVLLIGSLTVKVIIDLNTETKMKTLDTILRDVIERVTEIYDILKQYYKSEANSK